MSEPDAHLDGTPAMRTDPPTRAEKIANPQLSREDFEWACYEQKKAEACYSLGEWWQLVGNDYVKAAEVYDANCFRAKNANANSCHKLARLYQFWATRGEVLKGPPTTMAGAGKRVKAPSTISKELEGMPASADASISQMTDPRARSAALYARACALGNGAACGVGGKMALSGFGRDKSVSDATSMFAKGCDDCGDAQSCFLMGTTHLKGKRHGIASDATKAYPWLEKACLRGHANACQVVAVMHKKGHGVPADEKKFLFYKQMTHDLVKKMGEKMGATIVD